MRKITLLWLTVLLLVVKVSAQDSYNERVKKYVEQYYAYAIEEQKNSGIPASITLSQGILETDAGASELMTNANNHFGIKCNKYWQGETFNHDDDAPQECFKKYGNASESYRDHSEHLKKNPRYAPLFNISPTDYAGWAVCLKKCGYATNPQYALRLIKIIEDFKLQEYTYSALDSSILSKYAIIPVKKIPTATPKEDTQIVIGPAKPAARPVIAAATPDTIRKVAIDTIKTIAATKLADTVHGIIVQSNLPPEAATGDSIKRDTAVVLHENDNPVDSSKIVIVNGLRAFYVSKGEMLLPYAIKYRVRYPRLLEMNDLTDEPVAFDGYIYLEKKLSVGTHATHTVLAGETLPMIAQAEGMQLKKLMALNLLGIHEDPIAGANLELQKQATQRPEVTLRPMPAHKGNAIITASADSSGGRSDKDYVVIKKGKPAATSSIIADSAHAIVKVTTAKGGNPSAEPAASAQQKEEPDPEKEAAEKEAKELAALKADLDKVVYADDLKNPPAKSPVNQEAPRKQTAPAATTPPAAQPGKGKLYTIKRGDTAFSIAKRNNITVRQLLKWNNIDADEIKIGKRIRVQE